MPAFFMNEGDFSPEEARLQKELEFQNLKEHKNDSDEAQELYRTAVRLRHTFSRGGYMGLDAIGEQLLEQAEKEYRPIRAAREAARIKAEKQEALSKVIIPWAEENTPVFLTLNSGENPEAASGQIVKFSGFSNPKPFVIVAGGDFVRKITLSDKWVVSEGGERISDGSFEITAAALDTDAVEKLFGLPVSNLRISK